MSFPVIFYKYAKKINSTKIPPYASEPASLFPNVILKDKTNITNPVLIIDNDFINVVTGDPFYMPNYAYIARFKRYYYVTDMEWLDGLWYLSCKVDVLATYKTEIGEQSLYVTRSASESDGSVIDTSYPAEGVPVITNQQEDSPWNLDKDNGYCYVMGIAGKATTYYAFTLAQLEVMLDYIMSDDYVSLLYGSTAWQTAFPEIKAMTNPLQYITSINWYPFEISGTLTSSLKVGWVTVNTVGGQFKEITNFLKSESTVIPVDNKHPQAASRGNYLNNAPYSSYTLLFPGYGEIDLDAAVVSDSTSLLASVLVDVRTGQGTLYVYDDLYILAQITSQIGVEYQIGQITKQGFGTAAMVQSALSAVGGALSGNVGGAIGSATGSLGDYAKSQIPSIKTRGTNGGINNLDSIIALHSEFKLLVAEDNTRKGRPLCEIKTINTLSGFIQVDKADIDISCTSEEQNQIRTYMEGGFYYE